LTTILNLNAQSRSSKDKHKISGYNLFAREMFPQIKDNNQKLNTKQLLEKIE
jgi:hypothetical protein